MKTSTRLPIAAFLALTLLAFTGALFADDPPPTEVLAGQVLDLTVPNNTAHLIKTGGGTLNLLGLANLSLLEVREGQVNLFASSSNGSLSVLANGGNVSLGASQKLAAVTVSGGSRVELAPGGNLIVETASLSIDTNSGSALDVQDNIVFVTYTEAAPLTNLVQWLASGFYNSPTNGYWDGPGIRSSIAAADPQIMRAVGMLDNNWQGSPLYEHFPPQSENPVPLNAVIVAYAWFGDADLDSGITATDQWLLDNGFASGSAGWLNGDFDYDGWITAADQFLIDNASSAIDNDGDGIPDSSDAYPQDFYNGQAPVLLPLSSANRQLAAPGSFLSAPLRIFLRKASGESLANAPVTFSLNGSPGYLALSTGGNLRTTLALRTDETGELPLVYYCLPHSQSVSATITVTAGSAVPVSFTAFSDTDSDGMPDVWEDQQGLSNYNWYDRWGDPDEDGVVNVDEYRQGTDPYDPLNGEIPVVAVQSGGNQLVWKNGWLAEPLIVTVARANGDPVKNVTVHFSAPNAGFSLDEPGAVESPGSILLQTDEFGRATARFHAPDVYLTLTSISVRLGAASGAVVANLGAQTLGNPAGAEAPSLEANVLPDGRNHLHWVDNSSDENAFVIERQEGSDGAWVPIAVVPADTTDYTDPALVFKANSVSYRVTSTRPN